MLNNLPPHILKLIFNNLNIDDKKAFIATCQKFKKIFADMYTQCLEIKINEILYGECKYELIEYLYKVPKIKDIFINHRISYHYIPVQPNNDSKNINEFKKYFVDELIYMANQEYEDEEDDEIDKDSEYYCHSLYHLGLDNFKKEIEQLYCTPIIGQYNYIYLTLGPNYFGPTKKYSVKLKFDKNPSIIELMYIHCNLWKKLCLKENVNIDVIDHHYDIIELKGDRYNLIVDMIMAS